MARLSRAKLVSAIASGDFAGGITDEFFAGFNLIALVPRVPVEDRGRATQERTYGAVSARDRMYKLLRTQEKIIA